jgi:hypothetical protein
VICTSDEEETISEESDDANLDEARTKSLRDGKPREAIMIGPINHEEEDVSFSSIEES